MLSMMPLKRWVATENDFIALLRKEVWYNFFYVTSSRVLTLTFAAARWRCIDLLLTSFCNVNLPDTVKSE